MSSVRSALALLLCLVTPAFAHGAGAIKGQITSNDGEPLFGANVIVQGSALSGPLTVVSEENGMYEAGNLPDGVYEVSVSFVGYQTATRSSVRISEGGEVNLDFRLAVEVLYGDQIIVSASRRREKVLDAPASVAVVESDAVQSQRGLSAADYIVGLAGVDNAQTGLFQANTVARGFNNVFSGTLLTLVDNRISRVPSLRFNAHHFIPITNHDVDRVEVVLGPGSALYGPNSANGVMHIITRSPFGSEGTSVSVMGGERDLRKLSFRHAATTEQFGVKLSGQYFSGTDWEHEDPEEVRLRGRNPRDYDVSRISGELRLDVRPTEDLTGIFSTGFARINSIEMTGIGAGQADGWANYFVQGRVLFKDIFVQAFHNASDAGDTKLLRTNDPIVDTSTFTVLQAQHSLSVADRSRITYGVDGLFTRPSTGGTINGANETRDNIDEFGAYAQGEINLNEQLTVLGAARWDDHNHVDERVFSPRGAVVFKPDPLQTFRLTYNRAFSTPSAGNFFLDIVQARDAFGTGRAFQPVLGFSPGFDIRAQGTKNGFTWSRDASGVPTFRSPFAQVIGLSPSHQIGMNDARFSNVMWGIGRSAVMAAALPNLKQLATALVTGQLTAAGVPAEQIPTMAAAQVEALAAGFQNIIPQTLPGLRNTLRTLNPTTAAFDPVPDLGASTIRDIEKIRPTITETYEVGYKGIFGNRLAIAADVYRTRTHDFVAPLRVETPNVFLDPDALAASLSAALAQALQDPSAALLAAALGVLDAPEQGGNGNNTPIDEITRLFVAGTADNGAAFIPFGTVSPLQATDPHAVMVTYRNFGNVEFYGFDASFAYYADETWTFSGSYSHVNKDLFKNLAGIADIALNAPRNKFTLGATANMQDPGIRIGFRLRGRSGFPMNSGVYIGDVKSALVFDANMRYELPSVMTDGTVALVANASNMFNQKHNEFVGAPEIGRLVSVGLTADF